MPAVAELTEQELADRSGISVEEVRRLVGLGILTGGDGEEDGFTLGDVRRIRFVESCERAGLPLEGIGKAIAAGKLSLAFLDQPAFRWAGHTGKTYREFAGEHGIPLELMLDLHEALGFPRPGPDHQIREDDLELMPALLVTLSSGVDPTVLVRVARVYGECLYRITHAESGIFHSQIEMPMLRSGMSEREMRDMASQFGDQIAPLMDRGLLAMYHRHQEHAWIEDLIEHVESALEDAGVEVGRLTKPPAMCFLDLTGYTRLTEERGDEAAAELATNLGSLVHRSSVHRGGRPVKWLGDGVMFHFTDPGLAVVAALEMVELTPLAGLPPAHVGVTAGPVVFQDGDYYGRTVNVAARVAAYAGPGQVLVSDEVVAASEDAEEVRFEQIGPVELKGLTRPVTLHQALRAS